MQGEERNKTTTRKVSLPFHAQLLDEPLLPSEGITKPLLDNIR